MKDTMEKTNPTLDLEALMSLGEDERAAAIGEYNAALISAASEGARAECAKELSAARYENTKYRLALDASLPDFNNRIAAIEEIIAGGECFATMGDEEKLRMAYYIDRGKNSCGKVSSEELISLVRNDGEVMRVLEGEIIEKLRAKSNPQISAGLGNASLPLTPKEKPKTLSEASALAREAFGI